MDMISNASWYYGIIVLMFALFVQTSFQLQISRSKVESLPGFQGPLPFELETGYVGVGETNDDMQVFYYFIKSENNPEKDPLMLWTMHTSALKIGSLYNNYWSRENRSINKATNCSILQNSMHLAFSAEACHRANESFKCPLKFKIEEYNGSLPNLVLRPQSWTKVCSIIFVDLPLGTSFSYAKKLTAQRSDWKLVHHAHQFLRKVK
ncbi:hypothetical protein RIF29_25601 [Crotalaria pallida]|uniref:Uncharacterized protein n=1 Tax=Crotalaria pallida TaxID=3830 RepID=A0AAN9EMP5_CROPI